MVEKRGPWLIKKRTKIYKTPWLEVVEDKVEGPDGKEKTFVLADAKDGAEVLPIDEQANVYLLKEFGYSLGESTIKVVGGYIDEGETPLETAKRELQEEAGIEAEQWIGLGSVHPLTSVVRGQTYFFLAKKLTFKQPSPEDSEIIEVVKMKLDKAVKMVMENKIVHASSCVLILKAKNYERSFFSKRI